MQEHTPCIQGRPPHLQQPPPPLTPQALKEAAPCGGNEPRRQGRHPKQATKSGRPPTPDGANSPLWQDGLPAPRPCKTLQEGGGMRECTPAVNSRQPVHTTYASRHIIHARGLGRDLASASLSFAAGPCPGRALSASDRPQLASHRCQRARCFKRKIDCAELPRSRTGRLSASDESARKRYQKFSLSLYLGYAPTRAPKELPRRRLYKRREREGWPEHGSTEVGRQKPRRRAPRVGGPSAHYKQPPAYCAKRA